MGVESRGFWAPTSRRTLARIKAAARRYDDARKEKGRRNGPLGYVAHKLLEAFSHVVDFRSGRLEPSIDWLMERCRLSRGAVVAGLTRLRTHGFLSWLRRFEATGLDGMRGPQVRQVTNAYRIDLPPAAAHLVRGEPPPPVDFEQARAAAAAYWRECARTADTPLNRSLDRLAPSPNASSPDVLNPDEGSSREVK